MAHSIEIRQGHQHVIGQVAVYLARLVGFLAQFALHIRAERKLVQDATKRTSRGVTSRKNECAGDGWVFGGRRGYQGSAAFKHHGDLLHFPKQVCVKKLIFLVRGRICFD